MHLTTTHKLDAGSTPVHTVTIFRSDVAEVIRKFTISLKTGDNIVEISHLPHTMVTESLRVAGIGQAMLSDVVCTTPKTGAAKGGHAGKSDGLIKLEEERALLLGQKRVIDYQANILVNYAYSMRSEHVSPEDMLNFLQNFNALGEQSAQADVEFQAKLRALDKKIEKEINDPVAEHDNSHLRNIKVKLTINAEENHVAEISLTYLVKKASWYPVFDLRATTGADGKPKTKLTLHYRATVSQMTGEDWTDAILNLSTASPSSFGTYIPQLMGLRVVPKPALFGQKPVFGQTSQAPNNASPFGGTSGFGAFGSTAPTGGFGSTAPTSGGLFGSSTSTTAAFGQPATSTSLFGQPASNPPQPASQPTVDPPVPTEDLARVALTSEESEEPLPDMEIPNAVAKGNSLAANFQVKGNANIRSGGSNHKVAIAILNFEAKIQTVVVPRSVAGAHLHCTIHNTTKETHLLPGNMGVYLDDGYISNSAVPHVAPGDSFKCSLGRDNSVGVTFEQKTKPLYTPVHQFAENRDRMLYTVQVILKNKGENPIKGVIVRDVVPTSEGTALKVVLTKPTGLAEAAEGKDIGVGTGIKARWCVAKGEKGGMKDGHMQWTVDLDKWESKTLVLEWEVVGPLGRNWMLETHEPIKI
ncbi:hypothetical protein M408DRAFT_72909 [Serendipita vermifera MAFF 305830]|uniref:DUF4139 domain-containing protein n=1 Tax=Serendipita vermifera MAFF 305830 TaxID=933852 RepID=A0A0C2WIX1_SERVB|nr:hypothetical protein M408DRAFT_72909 [Serendipita vermifera MAFF 305830]